MAVVLSLVVVVCGQTCQRAAVLQTSGDVTLGGMFNIHDAVGKQCGQRVNPDAIQRLEAFLFAVDLINKRALIREKIGVAVYDTCDTPTTATNRALDLLAQRSLNSHGESCTGSPVLLGCVGDYHSGSTAALASLLTSAKVTQVTYGATASSLTSDYPYLVRTVPSATYAVKAIVDVVEELGWQDVAVVTVDNMDMTDRKSEFLRLASTRHICVANVITMHSDLSNIPDCIRVLFELKVRGISGFVLFAPPGPTHAFFTALQMAQLSMPSLSDVQWVLGGPFINDLDYNKLKSVIKGLVSVQEQSHDIPDFQTYFTVLHPTLNPRNPWFREYWEQTYNCTVGVTCGRQHIEQHRRGFQQAHGVSQTIAAVYTYVYAIKDARADLCPGSDDLCPALRLLTADRLTAYIKAVSFINLDGSIIAYTDSGDLMTNTYSISNIQLDGVSYRLQNVGSWNSRAGLQLQSGIKMYDMLGNLTSSYPTSTCRNDCSCHNQLSHFLHGGMEGGAAVLHGVFDLHGPGASGQCDHYISEDGIQALEAFYFAIDHINSHPRILPHVQLGAVSSDTCGSTTRARQQVTEHIAPASTVLDATCSDVSLEVAALLAAHGLPHISATATVAPLADKSLYPSFLRTVGMNSEEVEVIIDIIRAFGWSYVKLVYSDDIYSTDTASQFLQRAEDNDICVATQVQLTDHITKDMDSISNIVQYYLLEALPAARVVVLFAKDTHMEALLWVLDSLLGDRPHGLVWLAGHRWGSRPAVVRTHSQLAHGAITVDHNSAFILPFIQHFTSLRPSANHHNPWFPEYWQQHFHCHLASDFARVYNKSCDPQFTLVNDNVAMSTEVPYVIDAVYTYALALHKLLNDFCGVNASSICQAAHKNMDLLYTYMKEVKFYNGLTNLTVSFDSLGNGVSAFKVFNYQMDKSGQFMYTDVGFWKNGVLSLDKDKVMGPLTIGRPTKASMVQSACDECMCSSREVSDLQYEVQYAKLTMLAYLPIHSQQCSKLRVDGFAASLAFQYAIQRVNNDPHLLPNLTLGYMIFDTCSDEQYAVKSFNAFDKSLRFFGQSSQLPVLTYVHAFIGGVEDNVTKALNRASYNGQRLVQISPYSGSAELGDQSQYPYLLRTVGSVETEALVVFSLLRSLGWSYVSVLQSSTALDMSQTMRQTLAERGTCIATVHTLPAQPQDADYEQAVRHLLAQHGAFGVLLLLHYRQEVQQLFEAVRRLGAAGRLVWLATSRWLVDVELMQQYSDVARGTLHITADTGHEPYLDAFIQRLRPDSPSHTGWLRDFWQEHFQCRLDYEALYPRVCDGSESLSQTSFSQLPLTIHTINAVYAYAYGLTQLFEERCGGVVMPPCDAISGGPSTSTLVYDYIRKAQFVGPDGKSFSFSKSGEAQVSYLILNYRVDGTPLGQYVKVGQWSDDKLHINRTEVYFYDEEGSRIELRSVCPGRCNCSRQAVVMEREPAALHMVAQLTVWGIIVTAISLLGLVLALITAMFFMLRYRHPVVLGSTSSLSLMLLAAISALYLLNFAFMLSDTPATCALRRLCLGLFLAVIFSVLLIKVIRISRICNKAALSAKPSFISGQSQTAIACLLGFIQLALAAEWLLVHPPAITSHMISLDTEYPVYMTQWTCSHTPQSLVISLTYVYILIFLTLVFAFRARKAANYQHEALCILLCSGAVAVILTVWGTLYCLADASWTPAVSCIAITCSSSAIFACVFTPKMLILTALQGGSIHSESSTANMNYIGSYPVAKSREPTRTSSFGSPHPFPLNELSEQHSYAYTSHTQAF